jgi:hypothetical protein
MVLAPPAHVYDPATNELILFGGVLDGKVYNDVEVLTNANGPGANPTWKTEVILRRIAKKVLQRYVKTATE